MIFVLVGLLLWWFHKHKQKEKLSEMYETPLLCPSAYPHLGRSKNSDICYNSEAKAKNPDNSTCKDWCYLTNNPGCEKGKPLKCSDAKNIEKNCLSTRHYKYPGKTDDNREICYNYKVHAEYPDGMPHEGGRDAASCSDWCYLSHNPGCEKDGLPMKCSSLPCPSTYSFWGGEQNREICYKTQTNATNPDNSECNDWCYLKHNPGCENGTPMKCSSSPLPSTSWAKSKCTINYPYMNKNATICYKSCELAERDPIINVGGDRFPKDVKCTDWCYVDQIPDSSVCKHTGGKPLKCSVDRKIDSVCKNSNYPFQGEYENNRTRCYENPYCSKISFTDTIINSIPDTPGVKNLVQKWYNNNIQKGGGRRMDPGGDPGGSGGSGSRQIIPLSARALAAAIRLAPQAFQNLLNHIFASFGYDFERPPAPNLVIHPSIINQVDTWLEWEAHHGADPDHIPGVDTVNALVHVINRSIGAIEPTYPGGPIRVNVREPGREWGSLRGGWTLLCDALTCTIPYMNWNGGVSGCLNPNFPYVPVAALGSIFQNGSAIHINQAGAQQDLLGGAIHECIDETDHTSTGDIVNCVAQLGANASARARITGTCSGRKKRKKPDDEPETKAGVSDDSSSRGATTMDDNWLPR